MLPRPTIEAFDRHLLGLGLRFEGVVIGGSALGLRRRRPARRLAQQRPDQLGDVLPMGWRERVQRIFEGRVLVLSTLGRSDLLERLGHGV